MFGSMTMSNPLTAAAVIPGIVLLVYIYRMDKLEREPVSLLISLAIWGVLSTIIAALLEGIGENVLALFFGQETSEIRALAEYFLVVGLAEEWSKYMMLKRYSWRHPAFDCRFDGVVYAVVVSLGFAIFENVGYVAMYGMSTALIRAVTAVPGHACFGAFMGLYYGVAKEKFVNGEMKASSSLRNKAVIVPMLWHGAYDYLATRSGTAGLAFFPFVVIMFIIVLVKIHRSAKNDHYFSSGRDIEYYLFNNRF